MSFDKVVPRDDAEAQESIPLTKGGITTFMLNLMASYLSEQFEFVPYTTTRPPKRDVIDNWGYGAVFRGGLVRVYSRESC
jgi:hypothetical protein